MATDASVPYVPTPQDVVDRMLEMAKVGPQDYLIDLGSGDGRIVVTAARKHGARGFGVDLNPTRIAEANENARKAGVTDKVQFYQRDLFETDLKDASVVTMYLLPRVNLDLRPKLLDLKAGTRIVSHDFSMGDWKADQHVEMNSKDKYGGSRGLERHLSLDHPGESGWHMADAGADPRQARRLRIPSRPAVSVGVRIGACRRARREAGDRHPFRRSVDDAVHG